jgi:lysozyme
MNFENIRKQLIEDEGLRLKPYICPAGFLTIGVGRNLEGRGLSLGEMIWLINNQQSRRNRFPADFSSIDGETLLAALIKDMRFNGIAEQEAMTLLDNDIYECIEQLKSKIVWWNTAPEELKEVLVNMCFNMGIRTLMTFRITLWHMSIGMYTLAAQDMMRSKWARQVKGRAKRLSDRVRSLGKNI